MSPARSVVRAILLLALGSCSSLEGRAVSAADYAKLERNMRVLLCGRALMREKAAATARIVESPIFDNRIQHSRVIVDIADRIEREGCRSFAVMVTRADAA